MSGRLLVLLLTLWCGAAGAEPFDLIVCGSGSQEEYRARFAEWGERLRAALVDEMHHAAKNVYLLTESSPTTPSSLGNVAATIGQFARRLAADDRLFVYLIGHGSFRDGIAKLNLPGSDLSAGALDSLLRELTVERIVVVNAASASAAFINVLSGPGRIICTSTRSAEERNATWFAEYLIQALEEGSADQNRDERISVLEACRQAAVLTQARYAGENLIATEHALLDDDGDGLGLRLPLDGMSADGALAGGTYLKDFYFPPDTPAQLVEEYRAAVDQVEAFLRKKGEMEEEEYYRSLEDLLVRAARLNREIRTGSNRD